MRGRDPTSAPRQPQNTRGMWKCDECGAANDPENDTCYFCETVDQRPGVNQPMEDA